MYSLICGKLLENYEHLSDIILDIRVFETCAANRKTLLYQYFILIKMFSLISWILLDHSKRLNFLKKASVTPHILFYLFY